MIDYKDEAKNTKKASFYASFRVFSDVFRAITPTISYLKNYRVYVCFWGVQKRGFFELRTAFVFFLKKEDKVRFLN